MSNANYKGKDPTNPFGKMMEAFQVIFKTQKYNKKCWVLLLTLDSFLVVIKPIGELLLVLLMW